jgi:hypothetical protein
MDTAPYAEKMFAFHKMTFERIHSGLELVQAQVDRMLSQMLDQVDWVLEEYKAPIKKWQGASAQQLNRATALMNDVCLGYEPLFVRPKKKGALKTPPDRKNEAVNKQKTEGKNES